MTKIFQFRNSDDGSRIYLEKSEIDKMLNYCLRKAKEWKLKYDEKPIPRRYSLYSYWIRNYVLLMVLFHTGRRVSEIIGERRRMFYSLNPGLRPCDIYWEENKINFCILKKNPIYRKSKKSGIKREKKAVEEQRFLKKPLRRALNVDSIMLKILKDYIEFAQIPGDKTIFDISRQRVDQIIQEIAINSGIRLSGGKDPKGRIHAHTFRHSFAVHWLKSNNNDSSALVKLKQYMCHENIEMTSIYTQFVDSEHVECINKMFN